MDFTQHNKINSYFPNQNQNRAIDCRQAPPNYNAPNQQLSPSQKYQPYCQFPSYHHQQAQQPFHQNINRGSMLHHIGDGSGSERVHPMTPINKPYSYNSPAIMKNCNMQSKSSYFDDAMMIKSNDMDQIITMPNDSPFWAKRQETEITNDTDLNIEYFHCPAPKTSSLTRANIPSSSSSNPFQPAQESIKKFPSAENIKQAIENHQTYFFTHNGSDAKDSANSHKDEAESEREVTSQSKQALYKSRTKIVRIPHGVRIITEIVNDGECGNDLFQNFRHLTTKDDKKSKVTLTEEEEDVNDNNECNGDGKSNHSGEAIDEDEDGFYNGTHRTTLISL
jgi:hypothetical protein